jgi:hypothetical protein
MKNTIKLLIFMFAIPQTIFCTQGDQKKAADEFTRLLPNSARGTASNPLAYHSLEEERPTVTISTVGYNLSSATNETVLYKLTKNYLGNLINAGIGQYSKNNPTASSASIKDLIDEIAKAYKNSQPHLEKFKKTYAAIMSDVYTPDQIESNIKGIYDSQIPEVVQFFKDKYKN